MKSARAILVIAALALLGTAWAQGQQRSGRRLLNPVYEEVNHFAGPDTPAFRYKTAPNPASYQSDLTVRSEKPWTEVYHKEKDWVNAKGSTKLDTWEGAKFQHRAGKGYQETKFYSGKRAFEFNRQSQVDVNFPETDIKVVGGQPIHVDQEVHITPPIANETIAVASGDGPQYRNEWAVNVGSSMSGHGRRRSLLAWLGRHLLNPVYEEVNHFAGPDTPAFRYKTAPNPASYQSDLTVRSEKPWTEVYHKEKDWVNAKGSTKLDTWEGAKFQHRAGKGYQETKFYSGKRAFEFNRQSQVDVNFPETDIKVVGGQPIHVDQEVHITPPIANETIAVASGDGPQYRNEWAVNVGSSMSGHGRRRSLLAWLGRHLLNPVYEEVNHFAGPDTPAFRYKTAPNPASYQSDLTVRSEKPWTEVYHKEKDWVNAKGSTKLDTWEGAKFQHRAGKGYQETKFYSGKRAFEFNRQSQVDVNFPETDIKVVGGQPIHVDQEVHITPPIANETIAVASGDGPQYRNEWAVNVGSSMSGHGRRKN